jgi:hypothetical protein
MHTRQRTRPDAHTLSGTTQQSSRLAAGKSSSKHSAGMATWIELPDGDELVGNTPSSQRFLNQVHH